MNTGSNLIRGILMEATRRNNSRANNPRYLVHVRMPDGEMRTYPTLTDSAVNYDIENNVGQEVILTLDKISRITHLQVS